MKLKFAAMGIAFVVSLAVNGTTLKRRVLRIQQSP